MFKASQPQENEILVLNMNNNKQTKIFYFSMTLVDEATDESQTTAYEIPWD